MAGTSLAMTTVATVRLCHLAIVRQTRFGYRHDDRDRRDRKTGGQRRAVGAAAQYDARAARPAFTGGSCGGLGDHGRARAFERAAGAAAVADFYDHCRTR